MRDPYKILVSEIMLQQTQVARVLKFYPRFLGAFPDFQALASAPFSRVLPWWQGMGYNRRALALQKVAKIVVEDFDGVLPRTPEALMKLPGIGAGTAGAIAAFAFNYPSVFLETNIRRVFIHHFFSRRKSVRDEEILELISLAIPRGRAREWYYALMDYGAHLAAAGENPNRRSAHYARQSEFAGSNREMRGKILKFFVERKRATLGELLAFFNNDARVRGNLESLLREQFIARRGGQYGLE